MIPFDMRYSPELIFASYERISDLMPIDAGRGKLNLMLSEKDYGRIANIANWVVIVDDYLIQFSGNGNMYVLDIVSSKLFTYDLKREMTRDLEEWIKRTAGVFLSMLIALGKSTEAQYYLNLYKIILLYHTTNNISKCDYNIAMNNVRRAFGYENNPDAMRIENKTWYYFQERKTWGNIALNIFRDYFKEFSSYSRF